MQKILSRIFFIPKNTTDESGETLLTSKNAVLTVLKIAWPAIIESVLFALVSFIDMIMVSSLGDYAIASIGLTNQPKFIAFAVFMSLGTAVTTIVARRYGQNNKKSCETAFNQTLSIAFVLMTVICSLTVFFARDIMSIAGAKSDTIDASTLYFKIIMIGMCFNSLTIIINASWRGVGKTKIAMTTNVVANLINLLGNYLLIGGNLGFPKLGIAGAGIATAIGNAVAFFIAFSTVLNKNGYLRLKLSKLFRFNKESLSPLLKVFNNAMIEQVFVRIGFFVFAIIVAELGTLAFTTHQIGMNVISVSFAFGDGLSIAIAALVGQSLGRKRHDLAKIYSKISLNLGMIFASILSITFLLLSKQIFGLFSKSAEVIDMGIYLMYIICFMDFLQIGQVIFAGVLRGAGDIKFVAITSLISITFIRPILGYVFCFTLGGGIVGIWIALTVDQFCRYTLMGIRFRKSNWQKIEI